MKKVVLLCIVLISIFSCIAQTVKYTVFPAPPYMIIDEKDRYLKVSGIDVDIVKEIFRRLNLNIEFISAPWARALELIKTGNADIISSVYKTDERAVFINYFNKPYLSELPIAFYYLPTNTYVIKNFDDLKKVPLIGVLRNAKYYKEFDEASYLKKYEVTSQDLLYPMLFAKRINVFAGYVPTENYFIKTNNYSNKVIRSPYVYPNPSNVYIGISKKSQFLKYEKAINATFDEMVKEGYVKKVIDSYYNLYK